jgi:hypothetical protein
MPAQALHFCTFGNVESAFDILSNNALAEGHKRLMTRDGVIRHFEGRILPQEWTRSCHGTIRTTTD